MNIGLDFDGVITDNGKLKAMGAKKLYGIDIPSEIFKKEIVVRRGILTEKQYRYLQNQIYENREIGLEMEPVNNVLEYLPKLQKEGHKMKIVTSRYGMGIEIAKEWMKQKNLSIPIISAGETFSKDNKCKECKGLEIFVDDDFEKLEPLVNIVPHLFLFSWEYNKHFKTDGVAERVESWNELYRIIKSIDIK